MNISLISNNEELASRFSAACSMLGWTFHHAVDLVNPRIQGLILVAAEEIEAEKILQTAHAHHRATASLVLVLGKSAVVISQFRYAGAVVPWPKDVLHARSLLESLVTSLLRPVSYRSDISVELGSEHYRSDLSECMKRIYQQAESIARVPVDVVLYGESGTGKDTFARYIHQCSGVSGPFVHLNCAAIPESLFEAELFGVEAGAYTGASHSRPGRIELAQHGTLFLDEIDSLSLSCQAKLLHAVQYRGACRVGSLNFISSQFRLIVSTKLPLAELVHAGRFRADLYYRLQTFELALPPLRDRRAELQDLFEHFVSEASLALGIAPQPIDKHSLVYLHSYHWPGNLRELKSEAQRFLLRVSKMNQGFEPSQVEKSLKEVLDEFERSVIRFELNRCAGSIKEAAKGLGLPVQTLYYRVKKLALVDDPI